MSWKFKCELTCFVSQLHGMEHNLTKVTILYIKIQNAHSVLINKLQTIIKVSNLNNTAN